MTHEAIRKAELQAQAEEWRAKQVIVDRIRRLLAHYIGDSWKDPTKNIKGFVPATHVNTPCYCLHASGKEWSFDYLPLESVVQLYPGGKKEACLRFEWRGSPGGTTDNWCPTSTGSMTKEDLDGALSALVNAAPLEAMAALSE